jgi:thiopeptide-type bacteriocin biosynthesis protein
MNEWMSEYIYPKGVISIQQLDQLICEELLEPLDTVLAGQSPEARRWFFVRYVDEIGVHLRIRLRCAERDAAWTRTALREVLGAWAGEPRATATFRRQCTIRSEPYIPEVERYGGGYGIVLAERLFTASSRLVRSMLSAGDLVPARRVPAAVAAALLTVWPFMGEPDSMPDFFAAHASAYSGSAASSRASIGDVVRMHRERNPRISEQIRLLVGTVAHSLHTDGLDKELGAYLAEMTDVAHAFRAGVNSGAIPPTIGIGERETPSRVAFLSSVVHMSNNRFGIAISEEAHLSFLITDALCSEQFEIRL